MGEKMTPEEGFREALKDVVKIATELAVYCENTTDLISMCELAITNPAQLKVLMTLMTKKK